MYESMIRHIAYKYGLANDKDCLQEIRICLWYQMPKFNPQLGMKESTYAWQQIQFGIKNYLAKKKPAMPSLDAPLKDGSAWIDHVPAEPEKRYPDLYRALQKLEPKEKGLIHEYFFLGRTLQEIGNSRQCTREWTRRKIEKILKKLRRCL